MGRALQTLIRWGISPDHPFTCQWPGVPYRGWTLPQFGYFVGIAAKAAGEAGITTAVMTRFGILASLDKKAAQLMQDMTKRHGNG